MKPTRAELKRERELSLTKSGRETLLNEAIQKLTPMANYLASPGGMCEPGDLVSIGYLAMRAAIDRWEPRPGVTFWGYARASVKSAMVRALKNAITPQLLDPVDVDRLSESEPEPLPEIEGLTPFQRRVVDMRLLQRPKASEQETAKALGATRQRVREELWQALQILGQQTR